MDLLLQFYEWRRDLQHEILNIETSTLLKTETGPFWALNPIRVLWKRDRGYDRCLEKESCFSSVFIRTKDLIRSDLLLTIISTS